MKKQFQTGIALLFLCLYPALLQAQQVAIKKIPANLATSEIKAFNTIRETPFVDLPPLTPEQKERVDMFGAYLVKAALHRLDPAKYPLTGDEKSMGQVALRVVNSFSQKRFEKVKSRIQGFANPQDARRTRIMGKFNSIDLTQPSINGDLLAKKSPGTTFINLEKIRKLNFPVKPAAKYNAMDFIVRSMHCVDETDPESPGDDDMVISGTLFETNAASTTGNGFFAGNFDDGDYNNFGEYPFGSFPLNASGGYPKYLSCMLVLIEQDSDDSGEQLAHDINNALAEIGGKICDAWYPGCSAIINELAGIVNNIMSTFFDDDYFPPKVVPITLNSEDEFGPTGVSGNLATSKINGHGGSYKIGYKLRMRQ